VKKGWKTTTLGEVLQKTETVNPRKTPNLSFRYIDVSCVSNQTFTIRETQELKGRDAPSRARRLVRTNDVLFATVRPTLRRIALVPDYLNEEVCSTGFFVLRPKPDVDHRFVFYFLLSDDFLSRMEALQKGASYPAVNDGEVRSQVIAYPPLPEQKRIADILDESFAGIATAKAATAKKLEELESLKGSLLHQAFHESL